MEEAGREAVSYTHLDVYKRQGLYVVIGGEIDDAYMEELKKQVIHWDCLLYTSSWTIYVD